MMRGRRSKPLSGSARCCARLKWECCARRRRTTSKSRLTSRARRSRSRGWSSTCGCGCLSRAGRLGVLAISDTPEPLTGPFFEETIYVTPSRLALDVQRKVFETIDRAVAAFGLWHGPLHAELRLNAAGIFVLEVAARS